MSRRFSIISIHALCLLVACGESTPVADQSVEPENVTQESEEPALADIELCDAADYRPLIGTAVSGTTFEAGAQLRVFGVNDIITQEYLPQRTNVVYDEDGLITRVYCG